MEKYVFDITIKIINHKKGMTTTEVNDVVGTFFYKVTWSEYKETFLINNHL